MSTKGDISCLPRDPLLRIGMTEKIKRSHDKSVENVLPLSPFFNNWRKQWNIANK